MFALSKIGLFFVKLSENQRQMLACRFSFGVVVRFANSQSSRPSIDVKHGEPHAGAMHERIRGSVFGRIAVSEKRAEMRAQLRQSLKHPGQSASDPKMSARATCDDGEGLKFHLALLGIPHSAQHGADNSSSKTARVDKGFTVG